MTTTAATNKTDVCRTMERPDAPTPRGAANVSRISNACRLLAPHRAPSGLGWSGHRSIAQDSSATAMTITDRRIATSTGDIVHIGLSDSLRAANSYAAAILKPQT